MMCTNEQCIKKALKKPTNIVLDYNEELYPFTIFTSLPSIQRKGCIYKLY